MLSKEDHGFISQYVDCFKLVNESTDNILGGVLDLDHRILYRSEFATRFLASEEDVMEHIQRPDIAVLLDKAIKMRSLVKYLLMFKLRNGASKFLTITYAPIINPKTNAVVALYCNSRAFDTPNIWLILSKYYNKGIAVIDEFEYQIKLTNREKQVVFLFLLTDVTHGDVQIV